MATGRRAVEPWFHVKQNVSGEELARAGAPEVDDRDVAPDVWVWKLLGATSSVRRRRSIAGRPTALLPRSVVRLRPSPALSICGGCQLAPIRFRRLRRRGTKTPRVVGRQSIGDANRRRRVRKDALAIYAALRLASNYSDGIWYVDLAPVTNPGRPLVLPDHGEHLLGASVDAAPEVFADREHAHRRPSATDLAGVRGSVACRAQRASAHPVAARRLTADGGGPISHTPTPNSA